MSILHYRAILPTCRIKDITDLNVEVDIPDSNITMNYYIDGKGSKKNNYMKISQLRQVIYILLLLSTPLPLHTSSLNLLCPTLQPPTH